MSSDEEGWEEARGEEKVEERKKISLAKLGKLLDQHRVFPEERSAFTQRISKISKEVSEAAGAQRLKLLTEAEAICTGREFVRLGNALQRLGFTRIVAGYFIDGYGSKDRSVSLFFALSAGRNGGEERRRREEEKERRRDEKERQLKRRGKRREE